MDFVHISCKLESLTLSSPPLHSSYLSGFNPPCFTPPRITLSRLYPGHRSAVSISAQSGSPNPTSNSSSNNHEDRLFLAQNSIAEFLHQEAGLSVADSESISENSPKYVKMIVEGVRDLEEWNSWKGKEDAEGLEGLGFKEKVFYMVKQKGDGGRVSFLESLGLSLSSAKYLAPYLSSQPLPVLLHKVKYLKDIFFRGSDDRGLVGRYACRMMLYLSIPIDEDVQQTLSFFEKIKARRGGLDMMGSVDVSFRFLIESFPRLLLLSEEHDMNPTVEFLQSIDIPREALGKILLLYPPIMLTNTKEIRRRVAAALEKVGMMKEDVGSMVLKYPWILSTNIQENYLHIINFFTGEWVPKADIDHAIKRWPMLLGCSTNNMKVMMKEFDHLGVRNKKLGKVISKIPQLVLYKPREFREVVSFMEDVGLEEETVSQILCRCPELFGCSIETTLRRKLMFLTRFGVSKTQFPRIIRKYPEFLIYDTDKTVLPRLKYLKEKGLTEKEIVLMVERFSPILGYSVEKVLKPKIEFLEKEMKREIGEVAEYPRYLSYSLEKKIKPRFREVRERKIECTLKEMLARNDHEFASDFMPPFD